MVIWITGYSSAGKTSIGSEVYRMLQTQQKNVVFLEGDVIREILGNDIGYGPGDREKGAWRIAKMCHWLNEQGIDVVCATISFFENIRQWNRNHIHHYYEVYLRVPFKVLFERDAKGLYKRALKGEIKDVVGVDVMLEPPAQPDLILKNDTPVDSFEALAQQILDNIPWYNSKLPAAALNVK